MKVFYFTFLVLFLSWKVSAKEICKTCTDSSPAAQAECWACLGRNKAANMTVKQSNSLAPSATSLPSSTAVKKTVSRPKKTEPVAENSQSEQPQQSTFRDASCTDKQYPSLMGCQPCPGNTTKVVDGQVYCRAEESVTSNEEQCKGDANSSEQCLAYKNQMCQGRNSFTGETWRWSVEQLDCVKNTNTDSEQCAQRFAEMNEKCVNEANSAMTSCNDNNEEMQTAETTAKLIGAGSVVSMQVACSKIADLSKFANGAMGAWKTACATNQGGCTESCSEAKRILQSECIQEPSRSTYITSYLSQIERNINQCESYKEKIAQAAQHAAAAVAQLKASEQCKDDTSANLVKNAVDQCKANPNSPLCKDLQKCSDANFAAQNPVCACATNPTGASCLQASANYGSGTNAVGATLPGVKGGKDITGVPGIDGAGPENGQAALGTNSAPGMDGQSVGGRQGDASSAGSVRSGGSGGVGGSGYYAGGGNEKDPLKVNSGTLGGAPGMGPGFFGRNTASAGGGNPNALNGNRGDIAKFDPRKYITGMSGKGEYINGANQNIFAIVKMRYEDKKPSMLPENFNLKK